MTPAEPRVSRDGLALLLLSALLSVATAPFFGRFALIALVGGTATCLLLTWWNGRHPAIPMRDRGRIPMIDIAAIHVGGDAAGLVFVAGTVVIFAMSLPPLRWFVLASAVLASILALAIIGWRRSHSIWSVPAESVRRR
jgi:hypothetical protein